jgi:hypothetical protein
VISVLWGRLFILWADATANGFDLVTINATPPPAFAVLFIAEPAENSATNAAPAVRVLIMPGFVMELLLFDCGAETSVFSKLSSAPARKEIDPFVFLCVSVVLQIVSPRNFFRKRGSAREVRFRTGEESSLFRIK